MCAVAPARPLMAGRGRWRSRPPCGALINSCSVLLLFLLLLVVARVSLGVVAPGDHVLINIGDSCAPVLRGAPGLTGPPLVSRSVCCVQLGSRTLPLLEYSVPMPAPRYVCSVLPRFRAPLLPYGVGGCAVHVPRAPRICLVASCLGFVRGSGACGG